MSSTLYRTTLDLLRTDPRSISVIAAGAGVNRHWLEKVKQGRVRNPGVLTVEKLYNFLNRNAAGNGARPKAAARAAP